MSNLQDIIEHSFENRSEINPSNAPTEVADAVSEVLNKLNSCLLYTSPSPRDRTRSRMPSSA